MDVCERMWMQKRGSGKGTQGHAFVPQPYWRSRGPGGGGGGLPDAARVVNALARLPR